MALEDADFTKLAGGVNGVDSYVVVAGRRSGGEEEEEGGEREDMEGFYDFRGDGVGLRIYEDTRCADLGAGTGGGCGGEGVSSEVSLVIVRVAFDFKCLV